jgi:hypothetical protein
MIEQNSLLENLNLNLDLILSYALALLGAGMLGIGLLQARFQMEQVALILLLSSIIYLVFRKRMLRASSTTETALDIRHVKCLHILVFVLFTSGIFLVNQHVYVRPLSFLIVMSIVSGIIAVIICASDDKRINYLVMAEIFGLGLLLRASVFYQFPTLFISDPISHSYFIESLVTSGHLSAFMAGYQSLPLMHILSATVMNIAGLVVKDAMFIIGVCDTMSLIFLYLIIRHYFNEKIGMLAMLLLMVSAFHIAYDIYNFAQTFGLAMLNMLIYFMFCHKSESIKKDMVLRVFAIITMIAIVLTHTIDSFAALLILISVWLIMKLLDYIREPGETDIEAPYIPFSLIVFLFIFEMSYWMYAASSTYFSFFADSIRWAFKVAELAPPVTTLMESFQATGLRWLPSYLNIFLALIGSFYLLKNRRNSIYFTMYGWGVILFVFLSTFLNWYTFLPERWFVIIEGVLVVPLVIALDSTVTIFRNRALAMWIIVFIFSIIMTTNYNANITNLIPLTPQPTLSLKTSELVAANTLASVMPAKEPFYSDVIYYSLSGAQDGSQILMGKSQLDGILVLRKEIEKNACFVIGADNCDDTVKVNYVPNPVGSKIYDCGTVQAIEEGAKNEGNDGSG